MSDELTPITRKEIFLAKAGGQNVVTPTPITREETFLQAIIDSGSGGGGGTGGGVLKIGVAMDTSSTPPTVVMDKTWAEIADADFAVCPMENGDETNIAIVIGFLSEEGVYDIYVASPAISGGTITFDNYTFSASSPTDYPKNTLG